MTLSAFSDLKHIFFFDFCSDEKKQQQKNDFNSFSCSVQSSVHTVSGNGALSLYVCPGYKPVS